jgi:hypothetical protein
MGKRSSQALTAPSDTVSTSPQTTIQFKITGYETTHGCSAPPELEAVGAHGHYDDGHDHHRHSH